MGDERLFWRGVWGAGMVPLRFWGSFRLARRILPNAEGRTGEVDTRFFEGTWLLGGSLGTEVFGGKIGKICLHEREKEKFKIGDMYFRDPPARRTKGLEMENKKITLYE